MSVSAVNVCTMRRWTEFPVKRSCRNKEAVKAFHELCHDFGTFLVGACVQHRLVGYSGDDHLGEKMFAYEVSVEGEEVARNWLHSHGVVVCEAQEIAA